jgi:Carboxypeptidase regulatory-like domain
MRSVSILCGMAVLLSLAASLPAQTFGEITGEVHDPSGSVIAGSDVKLVSKATGAERTTVTNGAGLYSFPALQPGVYDVTATKSGFQSMTRTDLELQIQQTWAKAKLTSEIRNHGRKLWIPIDLTGGRS